MNSSLPAAPSGFDGNVASSAEDVHAARVSELEAANSLLEAALDGSRQREAALHRTLEGRKRLCDELQAKRDALLHEHDGHRRAAEMMTDKVSALLTENEALRARLRQLEQASAVSGDVENTASAAFMRPADAKRKAGGGAWTSDPSQMAATIERLEHELELLQQQLRQRTATLNDTLDVVHALTTGRRPPPLAEMMSARAVTYASSTDAANDHLQTVSAMSGPRALVLREKAELQVRVKELEHELARAQAAKPGATSSAARWQLDR
jgi:hypothetical protein